VVYLREDYLKNCNQAIAMYVQAVEVDENFNQSRFHLGRVLSQIFSFTEAVKHYSRVVMAKGSTFDELIYVYLERGITYLEMDKELKLTGLKSDPDSDARKPSEFVQKAINDFSEALKL
jgi:tetratricopeptide (TPR) repeat protein